jgi:hypothetical protein
VRKEVCKRKGEKEKKKTERGDSDDNVYFKFFDFSASLPRPAGMPKPA